MGHLVYEHQHYRHIARGASWEQRQGVGVREKCISEGPVHCHCGGDCQREHVQRRQQENVLELAGFVHGVHDLPGNSN